MSADPTSGNGLDQEPASVPSDVSDPTIPDGGPMASEPSRPDAEEGEGELRIRVDGLEKEKRDLHDRLLRSAADYDNLRKRQKKELDDARIKAREEVLRDILPGIDNLERALGVAAAHPDQVVTGVKLTLRQFLTALERFEIRPFEAVGQAFDPNRHEAISQTETAEHPPGAVAVELQRGYTIGGRLLRPALVSVARAPSAPGGSPSDPGETGGGASDP